MNKWILVSLWFFSVTAFSKEDATDFSLLKCKSEEATAFLKKGYSAQADHNTAKGLEFYKKCLELESDCVDCLYEVGWSYWKQGNWALIIENWEKALKINPEHEKILTYIPTAKENLNSISSKRMNRVFRSKTELLQDAPVKDSPVDLVFVSRWQSYSPELSTGLDHYDTDIESPKSVTFSADGKRVFVNSLEGQKTVILSSDGLKKMGTISHDFTKDENVKIDREPPFDYKFKSPKPWVFKGKPVESLLTHEGKYLWTTYYRRSFDHLGQEPSAMAIINSETNQIERVMGTGSISKYMAVTPNGHWLAVSNWGDNTVGVYDIRGKSPGEFKAAHLLTVEERLSLKSASKNRDQDCGFCLRGMVFTHDNRYLLVGRMRKGGIAVFDFNQIETGGAPVYLGTVFGLQPGPRDLHLSHDGKTLYVGCNATGSIAKVALDSLLGLIKDKKDAKVTVNSKTFTFVKKIVGLGLRSFRLSPDDKYLFVAANNTSEVLVMATQDLNVIARFPVDSFPVGLDVSQKGDQVWVTSQGRDAKGGNSVGIFQVIYKNDKQINLEK